MISRNYFGFTLAEVLITLGIIGVVAAITIPTLMNNSNKKETVVRVKKAYSILSQATELIKLDCGGSVLYCLTNPNAVDDDATARGEIASLYKAKLSVIKDCTDGSTGCFANVTYKLLSGSDWANVDTVSVYTNSRLVISDGTAIGVDWNAGGTFIIIIDTNGTKKPNQWGKDSFLFVFNPTTNTLDPVGGSDCTTSGNGGACSSVIIQTDKIDYY